VLSQKGESLAVIIASELIPPIEVDPVSVTPGVVGFVMTFLVAIAALALILDMVRRVRRVRYRQEIGERLDREVAATQAATQADTQANTEPSNASTTDSGSSPSATAEDSPR
jgi:hypothetical protein